MHRSRSRLVVLIVALVVLIGAGILEHRRHGCIWFEPDLPIGADQGHGRLEGP